MPFTPLEQPKSSGFTPLKEESTSGFTPLESKSDASAGKVFAKSAASSAAESVAAAPAMALGAELGGAAGTAIAPFLGPAAPAGPIIGTIGGGILGFMGGSKLVEAAADQLPETLKKTIGYDKATRAAERKAHPDAAFAGDLTGGLVLFRPGKLSSIEYAKDKFITPMAQRAGMATFAGGMEAGQQALSDEPIDWKHVAESAAFSAVAAKPTKYTDTLGGLFRERSPVIDISSKEWTGQKRDWTPPEKTADGIPIIVDKTGKTRADGTYVPAVHSRNPDGTSSHITIDVDHLKSQFEDKPWTQPKVAGVKALPTNAFKTPEEWAQFVLAHEEAHTTVSRPEWVSKADHENLVNELAMEKIQENPIVALPKVDIPKMPASPDAKNAWLADFFYSFGKNKEADESIGRLRLERALKEDGVTPQMKQKWNDYAEGHGQLDPREATLYHKYFHDEHIERRDLIKLAQDKGWSLPTEMDPAIAGENVARMIVPKQVSFMEQLKGKVSGGEGGFDQALTSRPNAMKERSLFVGEKPNGERIVLQRLGNNVVRWNNQAQSPFKRLRPDEQLKAGSKIGDMQIKEANLKELEQHSPYTYEKDTQGVLYKRLAELRSFVRANEAIDALKASDWFKENAHKIEPGSPPPAGFKRPQHLDKVPQFEGYAFEDRAAEIIEDFAKNWSPNALTWMSGTLIKNMMLNPLPHIMNEGWHLFNARGLTGWVTPAGITRLAKTGVPALKQVLTQGQEFRDTLKAGGSLLSAQVRNSAFEQELFRKANKEFMQTEEAESLAKTLGMTLPRLYDALSKKSNIAMWTIRDMMYMQQLNERMRYDGLTREQAVKETERHMPAYRITSRVGEGVLGADVSRMLSQTLQNPNVTVFSRYHYGLVKSLVETGKDISAIRKGAAGVEEFKHGVDTLAAIAVALSALYPLQDLIAQKLSGNDDAKVRRAGPYHIFNAIDGIMSGEKDPMAALASIFTFNPAFLAGLQLIFDRKLYNGQPVYHPEDDADKIAYDVAKYSLTQMPMISQAEQAVKAEDEGYQQWVARQFDVESPTAEQEVKREKQKYAREKAGARRSAKWRAE